MTARVLSRQVDANLTKGHSPGYLGDRMLVDFPLSLCVGIKAVWRININKRASGEIFRRKKTEMPFSVTVV